MNTASLALGFAILSFLVVPQVALGQENAEALVRQGEKLGREGKFREALKVFHLAEKQSPKAVHDCYIAVAHMRLDELTAARYFLDRCSSRASGASPIEWYQAARTELAEKTKGFGRLEISSSVADVRVALKPTIGISVTAPVTLWVEPGRYRVLGTSEEAGVEPTATTVKTGVVRMIRLNAVPKNTPRATEPMAGGSSQRTWGYVAIGGSVLAGALGYYAQTKAYDARDRTKEPLSQPDYDDAVSDVKRNEVIAYSLYGVAAAGLAAATYLVFFADDQAPPISVSGDGENVSLILSGRF